MVYTIAVIGFIYTLHMTIPMYSNSSFLSLFMDETTVGYIYMMGAALTILAFIIAPSIIKRLGNYTTILWAIVLQIAVFYGIISATSPIIIAGLYALQAAITAVISLCLDIFLEAYTDDRNVGATRGLYTTTLNASWIVGPLIGSMLINGSENYKDTYVAALAMLFPLMYMVFRNFPKFKDPHYVHLSPHQMIRHIGSNKNWVKLFSANFILQLFYSWMVVYSPIYLNKYVGFDWDQIGIIIVIMLLPFALIQYPLGRLADKKYGEKEMLSIGFVIIGISTILLALINSHSVIVWALALLITRIGAAMAEIMMETYFFKTVPTKDTPMLSMFRITRPLSMFCAPLITTIGLLFTSHEYLFVVVGMITLIGLIPSLTIKDTN
jgi:MFS family permease